MLSLAPKKRTKTMSPPNHHHPFLYHHESQLQSDGFNQLPDDLILIIFNQVSDIKSLARCRSVSRRFNSLVPHSENLLVKVDCVISSDTNEWVFVHVLKSILQSLQDLISPKKSSIQSQIPSSPSEILRSFKKIKKLEIELPSGDLRLEKGTVLRWKAEFGKSLKSCVILAVRGIENGVVSQEIDNGEGIEDDDDESGLKLRVVWTISALIAASARHYLLREVIKEHKEMESLVLRDRDGEGTVVMEKDRLREFREGGEDEEAQVSTVGWKNRTTVPAVRMRMRHVARIDLPGGVRISGATLVIVKPAEGKKNKKSEMEDLMEDKGFVDGAFEGVLGEAVGALLKKPSYLLEMNSF